MPLNNKPFLPFEASFGVWVISHTIVNDWLQTISLIVSIVAGCVGIYIALFKPEKFRKK